MPPGPNPERFITVVVVTFVIHFIVVIVVGRDTCSSRVKSLLSPPSPYFCHTSSSLFSPKILRSELLHGSWMDVGDFFVNVDAGIFWMLRRIVELGLSLVSGGMVLSCVVTPALEGVCWK